MFGLVPGSEIVLLQRYPSFVVEVGETVIALESEVAGSIVVGSGDEEEDDALVSIAAPSARLVSGGGPAEIRR